MDCSFTFEQPKVAEVLRAVGAARQVHGVEHRHVRHLWVFKSGEWRGIYDDREKMEKR